MMAEEIAGGSREPTVDHRAGHAFRALVAGGLVLIGLLAAVGGDSAALLTAGLRAHGPDWGLIVALGVFGLLLVAFGECLSHDPAQVARAEAPVVPTEIREAFRRGDFDR
jgi:hypothetical protein